MLQKKPLSKWTSRDLRKWREKLSKLVILAYKAGNTPQARQVIKQYKEGNITFREAERKLKELAKTRA